MKCFHGTGCILVVLYCSLTMAQDMPISQVLMQGEGWQLVGEGYKFTEAPAVDSQGDVYFADVGTETIYKIDSAGRPQVFLKNSGGTSGLMFGPDGRLYGCQYKARKVVAYDVGSEKKASVTTLVDDVDCNDLVVTGTGGVYFTDPKNHKIWYLAAGGQARVVDEGIAMPNGIILLPDQLSLVVTDTRGAHLWALRIEADGSLTNKQPYYTAMPVRGKPGSGGDGMTVDRAGRLFAATFAGLQVFDTQGRLSGVIAKPQNRFLSNVVLGGPKLDTLYVTCTDKVYRRKTKVTGLRYFGK